MSKHGFSLTRIIPNIFDSVFILEYGPEKEPTFCHSLRSDTPYKNENWQALSNEK